MNAVPVDEVPDRRASWFFLAPLSSAGEPPWRHPSRDGPLLL